MGPMGIAEARTPMDIPFVQAIVHIMLNGAILFAVDNVVGAGGCSRRHDLRSGRGLASNNGQFGVCHGKMA
jgi:hypothetical protein